MINLLYFIPFVIFTTLFLLNIKHKHGFFNPSSLLLGLYAVTGFCGGLLEFICRDTGGGMGTYYPPSLFALLYYATGTSLFLLPFYLFHETKIHAIRIENINLMRLISYVLIVLSLYSIFYNVPSSLNALTGDIREYRLDSVLGLIERGGILNTIASSSSLLFPIVILFFFWSVAAKQPNILSILLFISSSSYVVHILTSAGRLGFFIWPITFFQIFLLFKQFLSRSVKKKILIIGIISSVFMIVIMGIITANRFSDPIMSTLVYFGQNVRNANDRYQLNFKDVPLTWGQNAFPLLHEVKCLLTGNEYQPNDWYYETNLLNVNGLRFYVFAGLQYSFFRDFGFIGALIFGILFTWIVLRCCRYKMHVINFGNVILLVMFYQWPLHNIFYFVLGQRGGNLFILNSFILYIVLTLSRGNHRGILRKATIYD